MQGIETPPGAAGPLRNSGRFDYVRYDDKRAFKQEKFKEACLIVEDLINKGLPMGRCQSLALTKLEEMYMWIGKALRDEQIQAGGDATHQPKRGE
jgi:hypothetical protein